MKIKYNINLLIALKELRALTRFIHNSKDSDVKHIIASNQSFKWEETEEGFEFWEDIRDKISDLPLGDMVTIEEFRTLNRTPTTITLNNTVGLKYDRDLLEQLEAIGRLTVFVRNARKRGLEVGASQVITSIAQAFTWNTSLQGFSFWLDISRIIDGGPKLDHNFITIEEYKNSTLVTIK